MPAGSLQAITNLLLSLAGGTLQGVTVLPIHTFKLPSAACNRVKSTHSSYKTILPTFYLKDGCLYLLEKTETLSGWERMTYL